MKTILLGAMIMAGAATHALAEGDAARGEVVFEACSICHEVGPGAGHAMGPRLTGVIGRTAGTAEGFDYSPAMVEAGEGGLVWDKGALSEFLTDPDAFVPGNRMPFPGLDSEQEIADVIEYLGQFSQ